MLFVVSKTLEFMKNEINFQIQLKYHVGYKIHNSFITLDYCLVDVQKTPTLKKFVNALTLCLTTHYWK